MTLKYYFWASNRRKILDKLQKKYAYLYHGTVLDIGGRDRGAFNKPKDKVDKWIFADIEEKHNPDIVTDVADMQNISDKSIDIVNAIELFEHVEKIENGISECYRVIKPEGIIILSVPFLYAIHSDPFDFQRWTLYKWETKLKKIGFKIQKTEIMGYFFTVVSEMFKVFIKTLPFGIKHFFYSLFPFIDLLMLLDKTKRIKNHKTLGNFHGGYFIIAKK